MIEPTPDAPAAVPDIRAMRAFLRGWCGPDVSLDGLEVSYFQVDGGGTSRVVCEGPGPRGETLRLAARRVDAAKGAALEEEINRRQAAWGRPHAPAAFAHAARYARELSLLFQVFPADRRLPTLPQALDAGRAAAGLEKALAGRTGGARVQAVDVHVVRYKPEQKCLVRYDITWAPHAARPSRVYGRISSAKTFARTTAVLQRLRRAAGGLLFDLPEPLGVVPELSLELFSELPGAVLFTRVGADDFPDLCRETGQALGQFHALPVVLEREWSREATVERLSSGADVMARLFPSRAARIEALHRRLQERLASLPRVTPVLIHHDFHGDNVLADGSRLGLLDFEDCAMGDPADDVGSNWAQLTWHTVRAGAAATAEAGRRAFVRAYLEEQGGGPRESLTVHAALHGLLYAAQCLRHPRDPARYDDADAMLAASERALDRGVW